MILTCDESPPVVRGSVECHHPWTGAARSVCHPLSGSASKMFLNLSPYKSYTKVKCSNLSGSRPSNGHPLSGLRRVLPPVVQGDAECYHPLSGAMGSVTTRCLGRHGNSIGQLRVSYKNSKFSTKLKGQIMNMPFLQHNNGPNIKSGST